MSCDSDSCQLIVAVSITIAVFLLLLLVLLRIVGAAKAVLDAWRVKNLQNDLFAVGIRTTVTRLPDEVLKPWESFVFEHAGRSFRLTFFKGSFSLGISFNTGGEFRLVRSILSLVRERFVGIPTGDDQFDAELAVSAVRPEFAAGYFGDAEKRRLARALFDLGCGVLDCEGGFLTALWPMRITTRESRAQLFKKSSEMLIAMTR